VTTFCFLARRNSADLCLEFRRASSVNVKHFWDFCARIKVIQFFPSGEMKQILADQFKKSSLVGVRFLPSEKEKLKQLAAEQKKTLSELIRAIALQQTDRLNKKVVPEINRKLYFELGQVSKKLQALEASSEALKEFQELLNEVRRKLVGLDS
jgi:hypothetical protein